MFVECQISFFLRGHSAGFFCGNLMAKGQKIHVSHVPHQLQGLRKNWFVI